MPRRTKQKQPQEQASYTEQEFNKVFRLALRRANVQPQSSYTLDDMLKVADEIGLSQDLVTRTAQDFSAGNLSEGDKLYLMSPGERKYYLLKQSITAALHGIASTKQYKRLKKRRAEVIGISVAGLIIYSAFQYVVFPSLRFLDKESYKFEHKYELSAAEVYLDTTLSESQKTTRLKGILSEAINRYNDEPISNSDSVIVATDIYLNSLQKAGFRIDEGITLLKKFDKLSYSGSFHLLSRAASAYVDALAANNQELSDGLVYLEHADEITGTRHITTRSGIETNIQISTDLSNTAIKLLPKK